MYVCTRRINSAYAAARRIRGLASGGPRGREARPHGAGARSKQARHRYARSHSHSHAGVCEKNGICCKPLPWNSAAETALQPLLQCFST